jgi:hypothetical protein
VTSERWLVEPTGRIAKQTLDERGMKL